MRHASRFALVLPLLFAPWAFGTTERWSIRVLEALCGVALYLFALNQSLGTQLPRRQPKLFMAAMGVPILAALQILLFIPFDRLVSERLGILIWMAACATSALLLLFSMKFHGEWTLRRPCISALGVIFLALILFQLLNPVHIHTITKGTVYELMGGNLHLPHTIAFAATFEEGIRWTCLMVFAFTILHFIGSRASLIWLVKIIVANAALVAMVGVLQKLCGADKMLGLRESKMALVSFGPFANTNNFAAFANLFLGPTLGLALMPGIFNSDESSSLPQRIFWSICAAMILMSVMLSASRAGLVVSLVTMLLLCVDYALRRRRTEQKNNLRPLLILSLAATLIFLAGAHLESQLRFENLFFDESASERMMVYNATWEAITSSPVVGYGLGSFRYLFPFYRPAALDWVYEYTHNDWLELVFDFGAIGFCLIATSCIFVLIAIGRHRIEKTSAFHRSLASCLFLSVAGCLAHAVVDFPFHIGAVQISFCTLAAIGLALPWTKERSTPELQVDRTE